MACNWFCALCRKRLTDDDTSVHCPTCRKRIKRYINDPRMQSERTFWTNRLSAVRDF